MRVLQINSAFSGGGVDNQTIELTKGLLELGVEVMIAVTEGSRWEYRAQGLGAEFHPLPAKRGPLKIRRIGAITAAAGKFKPDIVHLHQGSDYWPGILGAMLGAPGARVVITRHLMTRPRAFSRAMLLKAARVVAVSHAVEGVLRRELSGPPARIGQAYCGIDTARFAPARNDPAAAAWRNAQGWRPDHVVAGVVGMFDLPRGKGQPEFIEAAARIHAARPEARFALVGQGSMHAQLAAKITALGLGSVLRMIPFTDDIAPVVRALDVLVHPAVGTDAFPLVVLEAMASARPVIASAIDGIPEQFRDGEHGFLVPKEDVGALAAAMDALAGDVSKREAMGEAGVARVTRHFNRRRLAEETIVRYRETLAGKPLSSAPRV
jgi:glycosyltransferase involved in cell wall biosynthesis